MNGHSHNKEELTMDHDVTSTEAGLHTQVSKPGVYHREICVLCGCAGYKESIAMVLLDGTEILGRLCHTCVEAGPTQAAWRARAEANGLRNDASHLEVLAQRVEAMDLRRWTPIDMLRAAHEQDDWETLGRMWEAGLSEQEICAMGMKGTR